MIPSKIVYDLLMNDLAFKNLVNLDMIFTLKIPEDYQKEENAPIVRINEIADYQESFSSNKPFTLVYAVQVDVWAKDLAILEPIREHLDNLMAEHYWSQYNGSLDHDPDIDLIRLARRYRTTQTIAFT